MSVSNNPVFNRAVQQYDENSGPGFAAITQPASQNPVSSSQGAPPSVDPGQLQAIYNIPATAGPTGAAMTINDVIMKTVFCFGVLLVGALVGWFVAASSATPSSIVSGAAVATMTVCVLIAFVLGMVNAFKKRPSPALILGYALFEGAALGVISFMYQKIGEENGTGNLVAMAVLCTLVVFAVMLFLYTKRIIKVTQRFRKIMTLALISYVAFVLISMVFTLIAGTSLREGIFGTGPLGILVSLAVVGLAAFVLCMNFDDIERCIQYRVPEEESWRMAFGLMVTLIWLYLEILRVLALLSRQ